MLAKPVSQITLLDVFMAVERDVTLFKRHAGINCDTDIVDGLKKRVDICIDNAADAMKDSLQAVTVENIWKGENLL